MELKKIFFNSKTYKMKKNSPLPLKTYSLLSDVKCFSTEQTHFNLTELIDMRTIWMIFFKTIPNYISL